MGKEINDTRNTHTHSYTQTGMGGEGQRERRGLWLQRVKMKAWRMVKKKYGRESGVFYRHSAPLKPWIIHQLDRDPNSIHTNAHTHIRMHSHKLSSIVFMGVHFL